MDTTFDDDDHDDTPNPVARLAAIAEAKAALAREESAAVRHARLNGMSWAEIGVVLGVSKQALHKRFGKAG
ncbi:DNA-directed RNA polymerase specialized sigma24 family protein [Dietzia sp. 2505]|uniref:sigma factor-like helix-turn-helix DNA-binding protein n=1 Tax=Dietzia sp. 2505 TaxID=3156457 RepID=UPI0033965063